MVPLLKGFAAITAIALLIACSNDVPDKRASKELAEQMAQKEVMSEELFQVRDVQRENGWLEDQRYHSKYTYNLVSKQTYPQMLQTVAEEFEKEFSEAGQFEQAFWVGIFNGYAHRSGNEDPFEPLMEQIKGDAKVLAFAQSRMHLERGDAGPGPGLPRVFFLQYARNALARFGLPDNAARGTAIPGDVTLIHKKTEKGWTIIE